jgi:hypothetical protein
LVAAVVRAIERLQIDLKEGLPIWIADGELEYLAVLIRRRDNWGAVIINGTRKHV